MSLTLSLIILFTSFLVFFDDELIRALNKFFAIRGTKLFVPLFIASSLLYNYEYFALWCSFYVKALLTKYLTFLLGLMPVMNAQQPIALVILLTSTCMFPVLLIDLYVRRINPMGYKHPYVTSTIILIICSILLIVL